MTIRLLYIVLLCCVLGQAKAQTYTGEVVDLQGAPLRNVSVVMHDKNRHTVAFTKTKEDGRFAIADKDHRGESLTFSAIGYDKQSIALTQWTDRRRVVMEEKAFELKEVKVRAEKIRERGDTLVYNVFPFMQGQDRSIADVIKRMPGFSVSDDGQIKFEGKAISNFYVEGMDLLGSRYALVSGNLKATKVKNVQVLQHHQERKSLRGKSFSDEVALNISLKDDAKSTWAGAAELGLGTEATADWGKDLRYDGKLMMMFFGRKKQNLSMLKANNTGKDITEEVKELGSTVGKAEVPADMLSTVLLQRANLDNAQTYFNTSMLATANHLQKTKGGNDLRFQADYYWDRERPERYAEYTYTDIGGVGVTEASQATHYRNRLNTELLYKVNNDKHYLSNNLRYMMDMNRSNGLTVMNGKNIYERVKPGKIYASEVFHLDQNLSHNKGFSVNSANYFSYQPGKLLTILDDMETVNIRTVSSKNSFSYHVDFKYWKLGCMAGFDFLAQQMHVMYGEVDQNETYNQYDLHITPSINYDRGGLKVLLSGRINQAYRRYEKDSHPLLSWQPYMNAEYRLSKRLTAKASYSYSRYDNSLITIWRTPIFTSYRTKYSYKGGFADSRTHIGTLGLNYKQPVKRIFCGITGTIVRGNNQTVFQRQLVDDIFLSLPTKKKSHSNTYICDLYASHSLYWGNTSLGATMKLSRNTFTLLNQEALQDWRMDFMQAGLVASSQPAKWCSAELNLSANVSRQAPREEADGAITRVLFYKHKAALYFFPAQKWEIGVKCTVYHSPQSSTSDNVFANLHVSYKTKHAEYKLLGSNLFNNTHFTQTSVTPTMNTLVRHTLRPREVMMMVAFDL